MFPGLAEPEVQRFLDGSARIALKVDPGFHKFHLHREGPEEGRGTPKTPG